MDTLPRKEIIIDNIQTTVRMPQRRTFVGKRLGYWSDGASTRINDYKQRHPILCDDAVSLWDEERNNTDLATRKTPSSIGLVFNRSYRSMKSAVESGDYLGNPFFKHWHGEKNLCSCNDHDFSESTQQRIRNSIDRRVVNKALLLCAGKNVKCPLELFCQVLKVGCISKVIHIIHSPSQSV